MRHNFEPSRLLALPLMANLATVAADGPRNAPVWFIWEDDALWMLGSEDGSSVRRLDADPRCAVEIVHYVNPDGILMHLGFRGEATIEPTCQQRFRRLLRKYLGADDTQWNSWFIEHVAGIEDPMGRMIRLVPRTTFANDVSFFRTGPELASGSVV